MTEPAVERRIAFLNPFGTAAFDEIIRVHIEDELGGRLPD